MNVIHAMLSDNDLKMPVFLNWLYKVRGVNSIENIPVPMLAEVTDKIKKGIKAKKNAESEGQESDPEASE